MTEPPDSSFTFSANAVMAMVWESPVTDTEVKIRSTDGSAEASAVPWEPACPSDSFDASAAGAWAGAVSFPELPEQPVKAPAASDAESTIAINLFFINVILLYISIVNVTYTPKNLFLYTCVMA